MRNEKKLNVAIGFATGRKNFQNVLRSYIRNWKECGLVDNDNVALHVIVAYDLSYNKTEKKDFTNIHPELADSINSITYIGKEDVESRIKSFDNEMLSSVELSKLFGKGYASQRNIVLFTALEKRMDYLIFLDDDEYPVAVTNTKNSAVWGGQHVLSTHIKNLEHADITHGYHCGYISPIPYIEYNEIMSEKDFRIFIEAISNDILNWDNVTAVMDNGGVTYADTAVLTTELTKEVLEINHAKFISGANLGINLTKPKRIFPFYNPHGARGEDTFLSTCFSERKVIKVPCYTFHDGFSTYNHLLEGVLPIKLQFIKADNDKIIKRFYRACIGWIRYKPLLLYITHPDTYHQQIQEMKQQLKDVLPKICSYFGRNDFIRILSELERYDKNVQRDYLEFIESQHIWSKLMDYIIEEQVNI